MRQPSTGKDAQNARPAGLRRLTPPRRPCDRRLDRWHRSRSHRPRPHHPHPRPRPRAPPRPLGRPGRQARPAGASVPHPLPRQRNPGRLQPSSLLPQPGHPSPPRQTPLPPPNPLPRFPLQERPASGNGPGSPQETTPGASPARSIPLSSPPLARSGGGLASRLGGGPLSKHTPHRGTGIRPGGGGPALTPSAESRPSRTQGSSPAVPGGQEGAPGTASFQPLKRSDYMSSAGIRPPVQRTTPASSPPSAPARRPGDDALTEGPRREPPSVPRRPLPPVAAPRRLRTDQAAPRGLRVMPPRARLSVPRSG